MVERWLQGDQRPTLGSLLQAELSLALGNHGASPGGLPRFRWAIGWREQSWIAIQGATRGDGAGTIQGLGLPLAPVGVMPGGVPKGHHGRRGLAVIDQLLLQTPHR